jgi:hypothetical protein
MMTRARGQVSRERGCAVQGQRGEQDAAASEEVGQAAPEEQEAAGDDGVGADNPLLSLAGEAEVGVDLGEGDEDDVDVEREDQLAHGQHGQGEP